MGSRIHTNVRHFFVCFCEVVPPSAVRMEPWIIQKFPDQYQDLEVLKSVPKFAYPYQLETSVIQHYSFVLTDAESKWTYGFCRHDPRSETAIVVLSHLPWHYSFYKFLDTIALLMGYPRPEHLCEFLTNVYNAKLPDPGKLFTVPYNRGESTFAIDAPKQFQLPSIPEDRNLTEYYNAVDTNNMMLIFASMLYERRIIFTSSRLKRLSACVQSANDVIYPMIWQHIFIPVLPLALIDYLLAPMPFLIGVPDEVFKEVNRNEIGDVVILNADNNTVSTPFDDLNNFPQEVISSLKKHFKNRSALLGDGVSRGFLRALVQLIGGYRDGLRFHDAQKITFDEEKFIESRPLTYQPFLREMLHLQIFQQFIEERLIMLNNGLGFSDEFELETHHHSMQSSSKFKQQYKDWTSGMKKEGSAFIRSVKDKANPAVKSAVKTVRDGGKGMKSAYKGLRSRLKENQMPPANQLHNGFDDEPRKIKTKKSGNGGVLPNDKPHSEPNSPTGKRRTIAAAFGVSSNDTKDGAPSSFKSSLNQRSYSILSSCSQPTSPDVVYLSDSSSPNLELPRMDLMNEMQDLLQMRLCDNPPVDRSLKPVRSLENFKHASASYPLSTTANNRCSTAGGATVNASPSHASTVKKHSLPPNNAIWPGTGSLISTPHSSPVHSSSALPPPLPFPSSATHRKDHSAPLSSTSSAWTARRSSTAAAATTAARKSDNNHINNKHNVAGSDTASLLLNSPDGAIARPTAGKNLAHSKPPNGRKYSLQTPKTVTSLLDNDVNDDIDDDDPVVPLVLGGGRNENGESLFLVANHHTIDIVKLMPPISSPRRKVTTTAAKANEDTVDLIRLDSASDMDDFDPLKSSSSPSDDASCLDAPMSLSNPLYIYENYRPNAAAVAATNTTLSAVKPKVAPSCTNYNDQALLHEYGLDFPAFSASESCTTSNQHHQDHMFDFLTTNCNGTGKVSDPSKWTKFD